MNMSINVRTISQQRTGAEVSESQVTEHHLRVSTLYATGVGGEDLPRLCNVWLLTHSFAMLAMKTSEASCVLKKKDNKWNLPLKQRLPSFVST